MKRNANEQRKSPNSFSAHATLRNLSVATESAPELMSWFAAGHEVLWIPIHEVSDGPEGLKYAQAEAAHLGGSRLLRGWLDCYDLPIGIKGWLFPAHLDDTQIVALRTASQELHIGYLVHPSTGRRISWRFNTEADVSQVKGRTGHFGANRRPV